MVTHQQFVSEARKWLNTPFMHQGRRRGLGVDCVGLVLCVMRDLGLNSWVELEEYRTYAAQPVGNAVLEACKSRLVEKPLAARQPGDLLVFRVPIAATHIGIVSEHGIIHALNSGRRFRGLATLVGRVVEHSLDSRWLARVAGCFSIPGIID